MPDMTNLLAGMLLIAAYIGAMLLAAIRAIERARARKTYAYSQKIAKGFSLFD